MRPEKLKLLFGLALCVGFIALGIYLLSHPKPIAKTIGGANIAFFSLVLAAALFKMIKSKKE